MKTIQCEYCGVMGGGIVLWNLLEDASADHIAGSTISTATMCKLELIPPQAEVDRAAEAILSNPNSPPALCFMICELQKVHQAAEPVGTSASGPYLNAQQLLKPTGIVIKYDLDIVLWIHHWFREIKGRLPDDDFVDWCLVRLQRGDAILLKHEPK